ncbi:MAG: zinc ribbon domain-containing protein [Deltaproteobacteria bacterium]|jgi:putative FmdB family regulatory protein|nr:zinc ribbon domain-containing protein [Deltaproteobacteria bacterium]
MPIYEYSCEKCRHVFEEWVRQIDDNVEQTCPDCGAPARRILSNTSFVLKGGGWYVTDYGYRKGQDEGRPAASSAPAGAVAPAAAASPSPAASSSPAGSGGSVGAAA